MPLSLSLLALGAGAFAIGVTEFVIMGLLIEVADSLRITLPAAGTLISAYAIGVVVGAPILTFAMAGMPPRRTLLVLMAIFVIGNAACALAPNYPLLMSARLVTALTHGTFFGVGAVLAQQLVAPNRKASAIAFVFTGLTLANVLGVPLGTWLGQIAGWRATFAAVAVAGCLASGLMALALPPGGRVAAGGKADLTILLRAPVLRGLLLTVLGYAGVFALFTYIAPFLIAVAGFGEAAISPILFGFGAGLVLGNLASGRLADQWPVATLLGSLGLLTLVLVLMGPAAGSKVAALAMTVLFGAAAFATVAPLQAFVMGHAEGAAAALVASVNIAAFNLGNAIGAWSGGLALGAGLPLGTLPLIAALFPLAALALAFFATRHDAVGVTS